VFGFWLRLPGPGPQLLKGIFYFDLTCIDTVSATSVLDSSVFCMHELTVYCCFMFFLLWGECAKKILLYHMQKAGTLGGFLHHHDMILHNM